SLRTLSLHLRLPAIRPVLGAALMLLRLIERFQLGTASGGILLQCRQPAHFGRAESCRAATAQGLILRLCIAGVGAAATPAPLAISGHAHINRVALLLAELL